MPLVHRVLAETELAFGEAEEAAGVGLEPEPELELELGYYQTLGNAGGGQAG